MTLAVFRPMFHNAELLKCANLAGRSIRHGGCSLGLLLTQLAVASSHASGQAHSQSLHRAGAAVAHERSAVSIAKTSEPAVVAITAYDAVHQPTKAGSGFFVSPDGRIVTNYHVIEGATALSVALADGRAFSTTYFVSSDPAHDLAVIRISLAAAPWLPLSTRPAVATGERIYVVGSPMGLDHTFSDGLVSANRSVGGVDLIQITAPISHGSSGGPVLDETGAVVGVASLTLVGGQNLNLAVPARYLRPLIAEIATSSLFSRSSAPERRVDAGVPHTGSATNESTGLTGIYSLFGKRDGVFDMWGELVLRRDTALRRGYKIDGWWADSGRVMHGLGAVPMTVLPDGRVALFVRDQLEGQVSSTLPDGTVFELRLSDSVVAQRESRSFTTVQLMRDDGGDLAAPEGSYEISGSVNASPAGSPLAKVTGQCWLLRGDDGGDNLVRKMNGAGPLRMLVCDTHNDHGGGAGFATWVYFSPSGPDFAARDDECRSECAETHILGSAQSGHLALHFIGTVPAREQAVPLYFDLSGNKTGSW